ncbi:hypothetical protein RV10_GL003963 [Enterococcus pallens]|nr:hypothetical protein RV10_GL003963 [Enterococcus pallens]
MGASIQEFFSPLEEQILEACAQPFKKIYNVKYTRKSDLVKDCSEKNVDFLLSYRGYVKN